MCQARSFHAQLNFSFLTILTHVDKHIYLFLCFLLQVDIIQYKRCGTHAKSSLRPEGITDINIATPMTPYRSRQPRASLQSTIVIRRLIISETLTGKHIYLKAYWNMLLRGIPAKFNDLLVIGPYCGGEKFHTFEKKVAGMGFKIKACSSVSLPA